MLQASLFGTAEVLALRPLTDLERVPLSDGAWLSSQAGWTAPTSCSSGS
jgi:hypothetical protein